MCKITLPNTHFFFFFALEVSRLLIYNLKALVIFPFQVIEMLEHRINHPFLPLSYVQIKH